MIEQQKVISDLSATDALPGAIGVGTGVIGAVNLNVGWINEVYLLLSLLAVVFGLVLTLFTIVNVYYKIKRHRMEIDAIGTKDHPDTPL